MKIAKKPLHNLNLPMRTEKSRHNAVEFQAQLFPLPRIGFHIVRTVFEKETFKSGVIGKNRSGQRAALNFHSGDDWQADRNRTAAESRKVIDHSNFFLFIM